jgi:hypothetical protein
LRAHPKPDRSCATKSGHMMRYLQVNTQQVPPQQGEFVLPDNPCPFKQMPSRLDFLVALEL